MQFIYLIEVHSSDKRFDLLERFLTGFETSDLS